MSSNGKRAARNSKPLSIGKAIDMLRELRFTWERAEDEARLRVGDRFRAREAEILQRVGEQHRKLVTDALFAIENPDVTGAPAHSGEQNDE